MPELGQASGADVVRLTAGDSLHATMLGAREVVTASAAVTTSLPVVDDAPALDAPLAEDAIWAGDSFTGTQTVAPEAAPAAAACPAPQWSAGVYGTTSYQYDVADRLTMTTAPDNTQIKITYDALGRKTQMIDPDMGTWTYAYDQVSNLTRQTDARNQRVCFYYDGVGRLKGKTFPTGTDDCPINDPGYGSYAIKFYYDTDENGATVANGKGRRTVMIDGSGNTRWAYDSRGRVTSETKVVSGTGGGTFVTQWTSYDAMDRVRTMMYPDNEGVTFTYTGQGPLKTVYGSSTYYVGDTFYNAAGQVTDRYLGSTTGVIRQKYTYTQAENFRLTALQSGVSPNFNNLQNITYTYDDQGNVLTVVDAAAFGGSQTQTFTYDALNRLLAAQATGGSHGTYTQRSYVYNNAGNISTFEGAALGYNDAAHKHAVTHVNSVQKYWYDQNGNATRRINGSQDITLAYDAENHVTSITGSGINASYVYDGDGKRVKATVGGVTTVYIGNTYERDNGTTVRKYYYAGAVRVAMRTGGNTLYLLNDHLTSTAITTNSSGVRLTELRYYAYGGTRYDAGGQMTIYRYTGQRIETGTGLYDYGARWYDPAIGRFLAADSIVPNPGDSQSLNRYMYVAGNPMKYVDPSGHGWVIPPAFQPILHVLQDYGVLNPMAPFYLLPTALGSYEQRREAATGEKASEALAMTADWYFEKGSADRELGLDSQITQALIRDEGVAQARQVYMQGGNRDSRPYRYTFGLSDAAREFKDVIERGDWSTSFLGGYEVQIKTVGVETRHTVAEFTVTNRTGWESATRVWGISFKQDEPRRDPGPGGTMTQRYQWRERVPRRTNSSQRGILAQ